MQKGSISALLWVKGVKYGKQEYKNYNRGNYRSGYIGCGDYYCGGIAARYAGKSTGAGFVQ